MKLVRHFVLFTSLCMAFIACRKNDLDPAVAPINIIVKVSYDTTTGNYAFPLNGISVKASNQLTGTVLYQTTDNNGLAIFNGASSGSYNVEASIAVSKTQYEAITGLPLDRDSVVFNATLTNTALNSTTNNTLELKMQLGKIGDWVLKQIYYAGSNTTNGALFRDQFIEIYNNSNKVLYADSLYFMQLAGSNTVSPNFNLGYFINDNGVFQGQWDWSKSIGITGGSAAMYNHVYAKTLFRIPGNGTTYPVQPGESFVIAATAINHKAPYTSSTGTTISINDPSLTVDLSTANFEVYLGNIISNPLNTDIDNPNVPNVEVLDRGSNRDLILDNPGRDAFAIFKTTTDIATLPKFPDPTVTSISATTTLYYQIPNSIIIDAVQVQHAVATSRVPLRLVNSLDAVATNVPGGQYSSQSLIRKTAKTVSGRRILMDTNNSGNDFDYLNRALPKGFK